MRFAKIAWASGTRFRLVVILSTIEKLAVRAVGVCAARSRGFRRSVSSLLTAAVVAHGPAVAPASASTPIGCAPATSRDLHVHLINEAGAAPLTLDAAEAEAGKIWANAGLRLTWSVAPVPFDLTDGRTVVVIVRRALLRRPARGGADSRASSRPPLGRLVFSKNGRPGNLIEVSFEALTSLMMHGSQLDRPMPTLPYHARMPLLGRGLGRVVAHEIGHWLMGRGHTQEGLMRASFGVRDVLDSHAPGLPRAWTAAGSELQLALSARCELDASHPGTRGAAP